MGDFGSEFVNFAADVLGDTDGRYEADSVASQLANLVQSGATPRVIYFSPRSYRIGPSFGDIVFPEGVELRFAPGARLYPDSGVTLIIRGSIRSGRHQIFGRPVQERDGLWLEAAYPHRPNANAIPRSLDGLSEDAVGALYAYLSRQTAPPGLIRIESLEIDEIYPEWWGATYNESDTEEDGSDALQACFDAACRDRVRDGRPLPALPVAMSGPYMTYRKLAISAPPGLPGALWLRGIDPVSHGGVGGVSVLRVSKRPLGDMGLTDRESALEVGPRVSLQVDQVSFTASWGDSVWNENEIADTIRVVRENDGSSRTLLLSRCGITGSKDRAFVCHARESAPPPFQERSDRIRACFTQCVLNVFRTDRRDGRAVRTRHAMDLQMTDDDAASVVTSFLRGAELPVTPPVPSEGAPLTLEFASGIIVRGGSLYVRGSTFHFADGPRPTRPQPPPGHPDLPDGQDIWLDSGPGGKWSTQLTVLQTESQSWWFLGGAPVTEGMSRAATVLLSLSGGNVNWLSPRYLPLLAAIRERQRIVYSHYERNESDDPPLVAWPGGDSVLVTIGCVFKRYVTLPVGAVPRAYDVGSTFTMPNPAVQSAARWLTPDFIPRPPGYARVIAADAAIELRVAGLPLMARSAGD